MILLTGGAGYIGSYCTRYLLDRGFEVIVADNLSIGSIKAVDKRAEFFKVDILDNESLDKIFKTHKIDAIAHFAALSCVEESTKIPQKYFETNITGTKNLLDKMVKYNVEKIIFSSTCSIYGKAKYIPIDELHPQNPLNPYGLSKLKAENLLEEYSKKGIKYIALRYFNAAGASEDLSHGESRKKETHLIPLVLKAMKEGKSLNIYGTDYDTPDGTCIRDYIHVEDIANAHYLALKKTDNYSGYLNLGSSKGTSVKEIIEISKQITNKPIKINYAQRRNGDCAELRAKNDKAKEILKWDIKYKDIKDIIKTAWEWEINKKY